MKRFKMCIRDRINDVVQQKVVSVISKVVYVLKNLYANGKVYIDRLFDGMTCLLYTSPLASAAQINILWVMLLDDGIFTVPINLEGVILISIGFSLIFYLR